MPTYKAPVEDVLFLLNDVFQMADRIIVLYLGRRSATFDRNTSTPEQVVAAITGLDQNGAGQPATGGGEAR